MIKDCGALSELYVEVFAVASIASTSVDSVLNIPLRVVTDHREISWKRFLSCNFHFMGFLFGGCIGVDSLQTGWAATVDGDCNG